MHRNHRKMKVSIFNSLEQCYFEALCEKLSLTFSIRNMMPGLARSWASESKKKQANKQTKQT